MTPDKANTPHIEYEKLEAKRKPFRAVVGGTDTIRATGKEYLPMYPAETPDDYTARLHASTIDGIVLGGRETLTGSVFDGEIDLDKVTVDKTWLENVDNKGSHLNIFAREAFSASFEGFSLILIDMPNEQVKDAAEERTRGIRPYLSLYHAADVINWRWVINPNTKQRELALLVLREVTSESKGRFLSEDVTRYRVFTVENGRVAWELWKEGKDKDVVLEETGTFAKITTVPVSIIGDFCDDPKLLVESRLEIKAYQKESSFDVIEYLSIPMLMMVGRDNTETAPPYGASAYLDVPIGGDAKFIGIDAKGHESLKETVIQIKDYIRARVNYLIESTNDKTATEVVTQDKNKQARLITWSDELKDAIETALDYMSMLTGGKPENSIQLNTSWSNAKMTMTSQDMAAEGNLVTEGVASLESFVERRAAAGLLPAEVTADIELERIKKEQKEMAELQPVLNAKGMPNEKEPKAGEVPTKNPPVPDPAGH
jgi:hypothetical protein